MAELVAGRSYSREIHPFHRGLVINEAAAAIGYAKLHIVWQEV